MAVTKIHNFKGIYSNIDQQDANVGQLKDCVNFDLDVPGKLVKRKSLNKKFYAPSAGYPIRSLYRFVDDNLGGGASWIALCPHVFGYNTKIYSSDDDGATWTELYDIGMDIFLMPYHATFLVIGDALYVSVDAVINHIKYQYIDRNYFWNSAILTFTGWNSDKGIPQDISSIIVDESSTNVNPGGVSKQLPVGNYYWQLTYIYDGLQESLLPESQDSFIWAYINTLPGNMVQLTANIPTATFNKRISAMNLYRKTTGTYSKVQTIGTTDKDPNLIFSDKAYCGDFFHLGGGAELGNNNLIVNQFNANNIPSFGSKLTTSSGFEAYVLGTVTVTPPSVYTVMIWYWNGIALNISDTVNVVNDSGSSTVTALTTVSASSFEKLYSYRQAYHPKEIISHNKDTFFCDASVSNFDSINLKGKLDDTSQELIAGDWFLTGQNIFDINAGWSFQTNDFVDWFTSSGSSTISQNSTIYATNSFDNNSLEFTCNSATAYRQAQFGTAGYNFGAGHLTPDSWYFMVIKLSGNFIDTGYVSVYEYDGSGSYTDSYSIANRVLTSSQSVNGWTYHARAFKTKGINHTYHIRVGGTETGTGGKVYVDDVHVGRVMVVDPDYEGATYTDIKEATLWGMAGTDKVYAEDLNLDKSNLYDAYRGLFGDNSGVQSTSHVDGDETALVDQDYRSSQVIRFDGPINTAPNGGQKKFYFSQNYLWYVDGSTPADHVTLSIWDNNLTEKGPHPYAGTSSIDVKYKFSKYIKGRLFCANVSITSGEKTEIHRDWIMYSEISQPDFIPVTNYIELEDLEGGEITGMEALEDYVVVFKTQGVFLLYVPRSDPGSWNLDESRLNIGCTSPESVTKTPYGLFWASQKGIYMMQNDGGIISSPITFPIADLYTNTTKVSGTYFPEKDSIMFSFTTSQFTGEKVYLLDLKSISSSPVWYSYEWGDWTTGNEPPWADEGIPT